MNLNYMYNIRCKLCKKGFNPKTKDTANSKLCSSCLIIKRKEYEKMKTLISSS